MSTPSSWGLALPHYKYQQKYHPLYSRLKPVGFPPFHRTIERDCLVLGHHAIPQHKICPANHFGGSLEGFEAEEIAKQIEMRVYAEIGFA